MAKVVGAKGENLSSYPQGGKGSGIWRGPWWLSGKGTRLPMQETEVLSLGREDSPEEEMATHPSILVWKIPWTKEPGRLQSTESQRIQHDWTTEHTHTYTN